MKLGKLQVLGSLQYDGMVLVYNNTLAAPATSVTISGLNGDVDEEYELQIRQIGGSATINHINLSFNSDTTAGNYGYQYLFGENSSANAGRSTGLPQLAYAEEVDQNSSLFTRIVIHAKSGFVRTLISEIAENITGTTVGAITLVGNSWNNTVDNITQIVLTSTQTNGLGVGTSILLYARRSKV